MADRLIYVAGNPAAYPIEYYDPRTERYQGMLPELLRRFAQESGYEIQYYSPGLQDQREELAQQRQVDLISGCGSEEDFPYTEGELLTVLEAEVGGERVAYGVLCSSVAPEGLWEDLENFLETVSPVSRTGLLLESVEAPPLGMEAGLWPLAAGAGLVGALLIAAFAVVVRRFRRQIREERRLRELDRLTGLGNLEFLTRKFPDAVNDKNRVLYHLLYFYTDMEQMERLYGREGSQHVSRHVAAVLQDIAGQTDLLARVQEGGFVLLRLSGGLRGEELWLETVMEQIKQAPKGTDLFSHIQVSLGILPLTQEDRDLEELIFRAGQCARAAYQAGEDHRLCSPQELERLRAERRFREDVQRGLERQEFLLYLQFYVSVRSLRVVGAEALCRWDHPEKGFQTPEGFISLMEREGFIEEMDYYMLDKVCAFLETLEQAGIQDFSISCNCSRMTVSSAGFAEKCAAILEGYHFSSNHLILEVTESSLSKNLGMAQENVQAMKDLGLRIALDDFGEGFTSFYDLLNYPVDVVKLDKRMVDSLGTDKGRAILRAMTQVCHDLGLTILAEGVETDDQVWALKEMGCDMIQGYRFYHPVPDWDARKQLLEKAMSRETGQEIAK